MIDVTATLEKHNNIVSELSRGSQKFVVAICDGCEKVRDVKFRNYRNLCVQCAQAQTGAKKAMAWTDERRKTQGAAISASWTDERKEAQRKEMLGEKNHNFGKPMTEDAKQKLREKATGRTHTEETKGEMSKTRKGVPKSEEMKHKLSITRTGTNHTEETKDKISETKTGSCYSEEACARMSIAHIGLVDGENNPMFGTTRSDETRRRQSATNQGITYDEWEEFAKESPYCPKFNERCRESNRDKYGRRCFLSGTTEDENGQKLSVHHVDMNKAQGCDGHSWKLVPLTVKFHSISHTPLWTARIQYLLNHVWRPKPL
jgi:hypothetical protein